MVAAGPNPSRGCLPSMRFKPMIDGIESSRRMTLPASGPYLPLPVDVKAAGLCAGGDNYPLNYASPYRQQSDAWFFYGLRR